MTTLIAEDLLLLLLHDEKGTFTEMVDPKTALGGAVLIELAITGAVDVEEKTSVWKFAKVKPQGDTHPEDPVLTAGLATVAEKERTAQDLVGKLGKGLKEQLADRLVERGILERREGKVLGLFPRTTWPAADTTHEESVRRSLTASLVEGAEPDERTGSLIALLHAVGPAHKVVEHDGMSNGEVRKRAKQIAEGADAWAAKAVKDAIAASTSAVLAVSAGAGAAAGSGGS